MGDCNQLTVNEIFGDKSSGIYMAGLGVKETRETKETSCVLMMFDYNLKV